jgi:hypothetical protein
MIYNYLKKIIVKVFIHVTPEEKTQLRGQATHCQNTKEFSHAKCTQETHIH